MGGRVAKSNLLHWRGYRFLRCGARSQVMQAKDHDPVQPITDTEKQLVKQKWQQDCSAILGQHSSAKRSVALQQFKKQKQSREAAYNHIRALDHALVLAGSGLNKFTSDDKVVANRPLALTEQRKAIPWRGPWPFEVPEDKEGTKSVIVDTVTKTKVFELPEFTGPRPTLVINLDQGSKMWSAVWFLQYKLKVRLLAFEDPFHRTWNDCLLALGDCGLKHLVYEYQVVANLPWGPWNSSEFWRQLKESLDSYLTQGSVHDDLFMSLYAAIANDRGKDAESISPNSFAGA